VCGAGQDTPPLKQHVDILLGLGRVLDALHLRLLHRLLHRLLLALLKAVGTVVDGFQGKLNIDADEIGVVKIEHGPFLPTFASQMCGG
jgi:hypothetical protein